MKEAKYSKKEINSLFTDLEGVEDTTPEIQTVRSSITQIKLRNLFDQDDLNGDPMDFVRQEIKSLTERMLLLQKVVNTFSTTPMKEIPTLINDSNEVVAVIARWRLKRGQ
jgi:hypothetical protein